MKLAVFTESARTRIGVVEGDAIADVSAAMELPATLPELLSRDGYLDDLRAASARAPRISLADVQLNAPIEQPHHFFAVGLNYRSHALEMGLALPERPRLFTKLQSSIVGPRANILRPGFSDSLDYEGELGIVIGKRCRHVPHAQAREVVAGYLVINDVSVREWVNPDLLVLGKGCATFAPLGPWLTTADEIPDPHALRIRTRVDGELRQDSSTADMVFDCWSLIEWITRAVELQPGDLISTGSPPGSGAGFKPPRYLQPGNSVEITIDGLGTLRNSVAAVD